MPSQTPLDDLCAEFQRHPQRRREKVKLNFADADVGGLRHPLDITDHIREKKKQNHEQRMRR